ncbi:MAG: hypothetical protein LBL64_06270, partial [Treponema sp.]|nr:hypothetical protein [Treponema sp.]
MKKCLCIILMYGILLCGITGAAFSADFGLILGTEGEYADAVYPDGFSVTTTVSPWVSTVFTDTTNLYVSGKMTFSYEEHREPPGSYVFEVERTELTLRPAPGLYLGLGRQRFEDAAGLAASGLFDGAAFNVKLGMSRLSLGAYYTGLLYKETAQILLTSGDRERYQKPLDSDGFEGYFASRRVLMALTADFPDLTSRTSLTAQALAQIDVNDDAEKLHTQYLELRFAADPLDPLHITLGGIGELLQGTDELRGSMAAFTGLDWELPGTVPDLLSAEALWTSGRSGEQTSAFTPVSGRNAG